MLSMSADIAGTDIDLGQVDGRENASGGGIEFGAELMKFAQAIASRDPQQLSASRDTLLQCAGAGTVVDAAAVAGNFQRMVRIADSTGIPLDTISGALAKEAREQLNLDRFHSSRNTPAATLKQRLQGIFIRAVAPRVLRRSAGKKP